MKIHLRRPADHPHGQTKALCGLHLLFEWHAVPVDAPVVVDAARKERLCRRCAKAAGVSMPDAAPKPKRKPPRPAKACERRGCDTVLTGRQRKWCSRACDALGNGKAGVFWQMLHDQQEGLCGICCLPLDVPEKFLAMRYEDGLHWVTPFEMVGGMPRSLVEVDHVVPVAGGGLDDLNNLRVAHRACNQGKKTQTLDAYRTRIGAHAEVILGRLADVGGKARAKLTEPLVEPAVEKQPALFP